MAAPKKTRGKIGVIGLGIIGTRVAANLRSAGHQVYVWSRTPRAAPNFLGSVVEVADLSDVIQLFVSDDRALQEVIRTVAAALRPRHVVLCNSTVSPDATRQAAGIVESQGARYLDAPFTGSKAAAQNKQLVYYIGGAKAALEEVRPVLEATSKTILHVGGVGDASVLKIATNMVTATTVQTLAEALALVRAAGIDGSKFVEALENNGSRSGTSDLKLPAMIASNSEPNFSLKHMLKDVRFAQELADKYQLSLPVTDTTAEIFALGMQNDWGDKDYSVVSQLYPAPAPPSVGPASSPKPAPAAPPVAAPVVTPMPPPAPIAAPVVASTPPPAPIAAPVVVPTPPPAPIASLVTTSAPPLAKPVPAPVAPPVVPEKSAAEPVKPLAPVAEARLAELTLPPRPNPVPKPALPETPATEVKPPEKTPAEKPLDVAKADLIPSDKKDKPEATAKRDEPATADTPNKPASPPPKVEEARKDEPSDALPKKDLSSTDAPPTMTDEAAEREKKSTFQFLRDFFKPVPTEPR